MRFELRATFVCAFLNVRVLATLLTFIAGATLCSGQSNDTVARIPNGFKLERRVTDPDWVLEKDELRALSRDLESRARNRALDFYLVIYAHPLEQDPGSLTRQLQKNTVTRGAGGVILVSFADQSVNVFLTDEMFEYISKEELQKLVDRAVSTFDTSRTTAENLQAILSQFLADLDERRELERKRREWAPWIVSLIVTTTLLVVVLCVGGFYVLRQHNLFGRAYYFHESEQEERYGGRMNGGHGAVVTFSARKGRAKG